MGRLGRGSWRLLIAIISLYGITACGGHKTTPLSPYPAKITLTPGTSTSAQLGSVFAFTATAQNSAGTNLRASFTFTSNDTTIVNISPTGIACAGRWDAAFTTCTPGAVGVAQVTATALNATSAPTYVFVHPPIDNITVTGIVPPDQLVQEPCLSQGQSMEIQATAYSNGMDVTSSVGPFIWTANNPAVVKFTPIVNSNYNFPTNQATVTASTPGLTYIYGTASGATSAVFQQPNLVANPPVVFNFFETCPIQSIVLELNAVGSQKTSFVTAKGTAAANTVFATITDVMGNSSLPNTDGQVVLNKIPLTWTSTQPQVIGVGGSCTESCPLTTPQVGSAAVTASCSPPICNVGFPVVPTALQPQNLAACASYLNSIFPQITSCQPFVPLPVYASPLPNQTTASISGLITGATSAASILATSFGCESESPAICTTGIYSFPSGKAQTNSPNTPPTAPNSLMFDLGGDKAYMGSQFGAELLNPTDFGTGTSPFSPLGTITGDILAISTNGNIAAFSDTVHNPNQIYIANETNPGLPVITPYEIFGASTAGFSPDGLEALIFGYDNNNNPNLYIYSALQSLQTIPLPAQTSVNAIAFSTNSAFAYVVEPNLGGVGPAVSVYNTCNSQPIVDSNTGLSYIPLAAQPLFFKVLPDGVHFIALENNGTFDYISASITPPTVATIAQAATSICPLTVGHSVQNISLTQGSIQPVNFFLSADGTLLYVVASDRSSILIYDFALGAATGGIALVPTATGQPVTPLTASMSVDAGTIVVAGSDGQIHEVSTAVGGSDAVQVPFQNLPNYLNPFCTFTPANGACTLDFVAVRP